MLNVTYEAIWIYYQATLKARGRFLKFNAAAFQKVMFNVAEDDLSETVWLAMTHPNVLILPHLCKASVVLQ